MKKVTWTMWPSIHNLIYTDIIPPAKGIKKYLYFKGVKRRITEWI